MKKVSKIIEQSITTLKKRLVYFLVDELIAMEAEGSKNITEYKIKGIKYKLTTIIEKV